MIPAKNKCCGCKFQWTGQKPYCPNCGGKYWEWTNYPEKVAKLPKDINKPYEIFGKSDEIARTISLMKASQRR